MGGYMERKAGWQRPVFDGRRKCAAALLGILLLMAGVLLFLNALRRQSSLEEKTLYSYTVGATGTPRVHLLENSVYPGEWLENGEVYPASLTDYIEFQLNAKLAGSGDARAVSSGTYTIGVELSGYYSTEGGKKTIFTRQFPLEEGEIPAGENGAAEIQKTVQVRPADYGESLTEIEKELGGSFERSCKLVFSGTFSLQCADKSRFHSRFRSRSTARTRFIS